MLVFFHWTSETERKHLLLPCFEAERVYVCPLLVTSKDSTFKFKSSVGWTICCTVFQSFVDLTLLTLPAFTSPTLLPQTLLPALCNGIMLWLDVLPTDLPDHSFPIPLFFFFSCLCLFPKTVLALLFLPSNYLGELTNSIWSSGNFSSAPCRLLPSLIF